MNNQKKPCCILEGYWWSGNRFVVSYSTNSSEHTQPFPDLLSAVKFKHDKLKDHGVSKIEISQIFYGIHYNLLPIDKRTEKYLLARLSRNKQVGNVN